MLFNNKWKFVLFNVGDKYGVSNSSNTISL